MRANRKLQTARRLLFCGAAAVCLAGSGQAAGAQDLMRWLQVQTQHVLGPPRGHHGRAHRHVAKRKRAVLPAGTAAPLPRARPDGEGGSEPQSRETSASAVAEGSAGSENETAANPSARAKPSEAATPVPKDKPAEADRNSDAGGTTAAGTHPPGPASGSEPSPETTRPEKRRETPPPASDEAASKDDVPENAESPAGKAAASPAKHEETAAEAPASVPRPEPRPAPSTGSSEQKAPDAASKPAAGDGLRDKEIAVTPAAAVMAAAAIADAEACEAELKKRGVKFTVEPSISEGECGVLRPVNVERLSSGVRVGPKTQLLCGAVLALDRWMSDAVVPAAKAAFPDDRLTDFSQASTYVCRTRSSEAGISEHARGSAIDIGRFDFESGRKVGVEHHLAGSPEATFQRAIREGACGPFKTVLGPGTDPDHASHFHLDIEARRNGATYCK